MKKPTTIKKITPKKKQGKKKTDSVSDVLENLPEDKKTETEEPEKKTMTSLSSSINKKYGADAVRIATKIPIYQRIPTGVFAVDYISGGGNVLNHSVCYYGGESSGKTTKALNSIAVAQNFCFRCFRMVPYCTCSLPPLKKDAAYVMVEGNIDRVWAETIGVDLDRLITIQLDNLNEYMNVCPVVLSADDCGIMVIDSVGAMVTKADQENDSDASNMGVSARLVTRFCKLLKQQVITQHRVRGSQCVLLYINQKRIDLGKTHGDKETTVGGNAFMHDQSINFRCNQLSLSSQGAEAKLKSKSVAGRNSVAKHNVTINKYKVFTLQKKAEYFRSVDFEHPDLGRIDGDVLDYNTLIKTGLDVGAIVKVSKGYECLGTMHRTQGDLIKMMAEDRVTKWELGRLTTELAVKAVRGDD